MLRPTLHILEPFAWCEAVNMSDDEYYDDEYADFHDMLYDADPDPDLADDLAEHAAHSPVYIDNPNDDARDYFSDWEYYSDDYFDDDPVLLGAMSKDQSEDKQTSRNTQQPTKRGRKRKLSEARERAHSETKEMRALRACMQGTVWKTQSPELEESYKGGNSQPVALRLSKAIMKSAYSRKKGFGTGRVARDESWANDLSLADMGLRTETSIDVQHGNSVLNEELIDEEEEMIDEEIDMDQEMVEEELHLPGSDGHKPALQRISPSRKPTIQGQMGGISLEDSEHEEEQRKTKRRKVATTESSTASKNSFITPATSLEPDVSDTAMDIELQTEAVPPKKHRGRPKKQPTTTSQKSATHTVLQPASTDASQVRQSSQDESTATASTASSRAKRNASSSTTATSAKTTKAGASKVTKSTRKTRSQHK